MELLKAYGLAFMLVDITAILAALHIGVAIVLYRKLTLKCHARTDEYLKSDRKCNNEI